LKALIYLTDKRDGKARQALELPHEEKHLDPGKRLDELLKRLAARAAAESPPS